MTAKNGKIDISFDDNTSELDQMCNMFDVINICRVFGNTVWNIPVFDLLWTKR